MSERSGAIIEALSLTKVYGGKAAVDGLDFQVKPGVVTGFLGPNGAGKSTTMRMILGLDPEGIIWIRTLMRSLAAEGRTVLVSSHLMSEMALTADHLLVIGRGRMIADMPLAELMARHSGERVEVRSADPQRMAADLRAAGAQVALEPDGTLGVVGLESKKIGELAAERGHVLHQLRDVTASLEEAYFRLTGESVEYRAAAPVAA